MIDLKAEYARLQGESVARGSISPIDGDIVRVERAGIGELADQRDRLVLVDYGHHHVEPPDLQVRIGWRDVLDHQVPATGGTAAVIVDDANVNHEYVFTLTGRVLSVVQILMEHDERLTRDPRLRGDWRTVGPVDLDRMRVLQPLISKQPVSQLKRDPLVFEDLGRCNAQFVGVDDRGGDVDHRHCGLGNGDAVVVVGHGDSDIVLIGRTVAWIVVEVLMASGEGERPCAQSELGRLGAVTPINRHGVGIQRARVTDRHVQRRAAVLVYVRLGEAG